MVMTKKGKDLRYELKKNLKSDKKAKEAFYAIDNRGKDKGLEKKISFKKKK